MKITFLGTAAATSIPLMFCRCNTCEQARKLGGKDFRKRSSLLINQDLLIDLGSDIMSASFMHGVSIADVRYCLQTHPHSDHFDASHLSTRIPEYAVENVPHLEIYASGGTLKKMSEMLKNEGYITDLFDSKEKERLNLDIYPVKHFQSFNAGKYQITAFPTNHDKSVDSLFYTITENNYTVLYGTDTDIITEEVWKSFHDKNIHFDVVILDHTYGVNINGGGHLNANQFIEHLKRTKREGLLKKKPAFLPLTYRTKETPYILN